MAGLAVAYHVDSERCRTQTHRRMLAQHGKTIYIIDANPSEWKEVEEQLPVLSEFINDRFVFDDYTPSELAHTV